MKKNFDNDGVNFETSVFVNCIVVVESLGSGDLNTGRKLAEDLELACRLNNWGLRYERVASRVEFSALLDRLARESSEAGLRPILHLEMHGSPVDGLTLSSGDFVSWYDFAAQTRQIVRATDNNFVVVSAVCFGMYAIAEANIWDATPFTMLVGSDRAVKQGEILPAFVPFYRDLIANGLITDASRFLPTGYSTYICERVLVQGYAKYYRRSVVGRGGDERVEQLVTALRRKDSSRKLNVLRREVRERLRSGVDFERAKRQFLLSDRPSNKTRFVIDFLVVKEFVQNAIKKGL